MVVASTFTSSSKNQCLEYTFIFVSMHAQHWYQQPLAFINRSNAEGICWVVFSLFSFTWYLIYWLCIIDCVLPSLPSELCYTLLSCILFAQLLLTACISELFLSLLIQYKLPGCIWLLLVFGLCLWLLIQYHIVPMPGSWLVIFCSQFCTSGCNTDPPQYLCLSVSSQSHFQECRRYKRSPPIFSARYMIAIGPPLHLWSLLLLGEIDSFI